MCGACFNLWKLLGTSSLPAEFPVCWGYFLLTALHIGRALSDRDTYSLEESLKEEFLKDPFDTDPAYLPSKAVRQNA